MESLAARVGEGLASDLLVNDRGGPGPLANTVKKGTAPGRVGDIVAAYELRPASEADFGFVFRLNKTNMRRYVEILRGWDDDAEREDLRSGFRPGVDQIITLAGEDIGRLVVERFPDRIEIRHIEILPEYQGRGIGSQVILDVLREAREAGLPVTLTVLNMNPARRLYERLGFRAVEEFDAGPKGIKVRMRAEAFHPSHQ